MIDEKWLLEIYRDGNLFFSVTRNGTQISSFLPSFRPTRGASLDILLHHTSNSILSKTRRRTSQQLIHGRERFRLSDINVSFGNSFQTSCISRRDGKACRLRELMLICNVQRDRRSVTASRSTNVDTMAQKIRYRVFRLHRESKRTMRDICSL